MAGVCHTHPSNLISCFISFRTVADRLLNMRLVPSRALLRRDVSYEFMNRQMVWHAFTVCTETLQELLVLTSSLGISAVPFASHKCSESTPSSKSYHSIIRVNTVQAPIGIRQTLRCFKHSTAYIPSFWQVSFIARGSVRHLCRKCFIQSQYGRFGKRVYRNYGLAIQF